MALALRAGAFAILSLVSAGAFAASAPMIEGPYAPRDECAGVEGAAAFRAALADAVRRRDASALLALSAEDVALDFGGSSGRDELRTRLGDEHGPELWQALDAILALGCASGDGEFFMPWFFAQNLADYDPFKVMLVAGERVPLRAKPASAALPVRLLSWTLVRPLAEFDPEQSFQPVEVAGQALVGFVETSRLRSPIDYRLVVRKADGAWRIDAFIAGD